MKKIFALLALVSCVSNVWAQYEGTTFEQRIAGPDSLTIRQNFSLMNTMYKEKNYTEAYDYWKFLIEKAPISRLEVYTKGVDILNKLIETETDQAKKKGYFEELMALYDKRIENIDKLNSCKDLKKTTKGAVLCRKAYDYDDYGEGLVDGFSHDKAYEMMAEGVKLVDEDPSVEVENFVLDKYFMLSNAQYKKNPDAFREQYLNDYLLCAEVCQKMLAKANQAEDKAEAKKIVDRYDPVYNRANVLFDNSGAGTKENILAIYNNSVEQNKSDVGYLRTALNVLASNDCDDEDIYYKAAQYANDIEPDVLSSMGMAAKMEKENKMDQAISYYNQAVQAGGSDENKAAIALKVAYALSKNKHYDRVEPFLLLAENNPANKGKCDLYRARKAAMEKQFTDAIAYTKQAAEEDPSISGTATRLEEQIRNYEQNVKAFEERQKALAAQRAAAEQQMKQAKNNAKTQQAKAEYEKKLAEYNKKKAEYDAAVAKQKRMQNFWNGK